MLVTAVGSLGAGTRDWEVVVAVDEHKSTDLSFEIKEGVVVAASTSFLVFDPSNNGLKACINPTPRS